MKDEKDKWYDRRVSGCQGDYLWFSKLINQKDAGWRGTAVSHRVLDSESPSSTLTFNRLAVLLKTHAQPLQQRSWSEQSTVSAGCSIYFWIEVAAHDALYTYLTANIKIIAICVNAALLLSYVETNMHAFTLQRVWCWIVLWHLLACCTNRL